MMLNPKFSQPKEPVRAKGDIHVLALIKPVDTHILLFNKQTREEALRTLGRWASNPELSFSWYDCARMSQEIGK